MFSLSQQCNSRAMVPALRSCHFVSGPWEQPSREWATGATLDLQEKHKHNRVWETVSSARPPKNSESQEMREEEETLRVGTLEVQVPVQGQGRRTVPSGELSIPEQTAVPPGEKWDLRQGRIHTPTRRVKEAMNHMFSTECRGTISWARLRRNVTTGLQGPLATVWF